MYHTYMFLAVILSVASGLVADTKVISENRFHNAFDHVTPSVGIFFCQSSVNWNITYFPHPPTTNIQHAMLYAVSIVDRYLVIRYPINVQVMFAPLGVNSQGQLILGEGHVAEWRANGSVSLPIALANSAEGTDLSTSLPDIWISFNSEVAFHYETDDSSPAGDQFDFVTVALHELLHGLGFEGGFGCDCSGSYPLLVNEVEPITIYDPQVQNGNNVTLISAWDEGKVAEFYGGSDLLYFRTDDSELIPLYSPHPYIDRSAIYHVNDQGLMRHALSAGDMIRVIEPNVLRMLRTIGWDLQPSPLDSAISASNRSMPPWGICALCILCYGLTLQF